MKQATTTGKGYVIHALTINSSFNTLVFRSRQKHTAEITCD